MLAILVEHRLVIDTQTQTHMYYTLYSQIQTDRQTDTGHGIYRAEAQSIARAEAQSIARAVRTSHAHK